MEVIYKGRPIECSSGVISPRHNRELYESIIEWLKPFGYSFSGGSILDGLLFFGVDNRLSANANNYIKESFKKYFVTDLTVILDGQRV